MLYEAHDGHVVNLDYVRGIYITEWRGHWHVIARFSSEGDDILYTGEDEDACQKYLAKLKQHLPLHTVGGPRHPDWEREAANRDTPEPESVGTAASKATYRNQIRDFIVSLLTEQGAPASSETDKKTGTLRREVATVPASQTSWETLLAYWVAEKIISVVEAEAYCALVTEARDKATLDRQCKNYRSEANHNAELANEYLRMKIKAEESLAKLQTEASAIKAYKSRKSFPLEGGPSESTSSDETTRVDGSGETRT